MVSLRGVWLVPRISSFPAVQRAISQCAMATGGALVDSRVLYLSPDWQLTVGVVPVCNRWPLLLTSLTRVQRGREEERFHPWHSSATYKAFHPFPSPPSLSYNSFWILNHNPGLCPWVGIPHRRPHTPPFKSFLFFFCYFFSIYFFSLVFLSATSVLSFYYV